MTTARYDSFGAVAADANGNAYVTGQSGGVERCRTW